MLALFALLLACLALPAQAQSFPPLTGLVVDAANVLPPATKIAIEQKLDDLQRTTGRQLVVATIPDLQGYPLEDYGYRLGRAWGLGLKGLNNGAILFIAPNEPAGHRGPRIEVGYGLEPVLTDALSSVIISQTMMPRLRAQDVPGAMIAGTDAIIAQLKLPEADALAKTKAAAAEFDKTRTTTVRRGGTPLSLVFWLFIAGFVLLSLFRGGGGGGGGGRRFRSGGLPFMLWGSGLGGGGSGGFGGFGGGSGGGSSGGGGWMGGGFTGGGGGSFGGGGASGGW